MNVHFDLSDKLKKEKNAKGRLLTKTKIKFLFLENGRFKGGEQIVIGASHSPADRFPPSHSLTRSLSSTRGRQHGTSRERGYMYSLPPPSAPSCSSPSNPRRCMRAVPGTRRSRRGSGEARPRRARSRPPCGFSPGGSALSSRMREGEDRGPVRFPPLGASRAAAGRGG